MESESNFFNIRWILDNEYRDIVSFTKSFLFQTICSLFTTFIYHQKVKESNQIQTKLFREKQSIKLSRFLHFPDSWFLALSHISFCPGHSRGSKIERQWRVPTLQGRK